MPFIECWGIANNRHVIRADQVAAIAQSGTGCIVTLVGNSESFVLRESATDLLDRIQAALATPPAPAAPGF